jgi:hypothetical protein
MSHKPDITCKISEVGWKHLTCFLHTHMWQKIFKHAGPCFASNTWLHSFQGLLWCVCAQQCDWFSINLTIPIWKERNTKTNNAVFVISTNCFSIFLSCHKQEIEKLTCTIQMLHRSMAVANKELWIFCYIYMYICILFPILPVGGNCWLFYVVSNFEAI